MLYALAFLSGSAASPLLGRYADYRRRMRHEAWQAIVHPKRLRLSEVYRRQGSYNTPES